MGLSIDGNDILFDGQVRVTNGQNVDTGVAYLILTPSGGVGTLPFFATGDPGLPPVFDSITVEEVDPGDPLPSPNPVVTLVSPGGSGSASHYTLKFYIHKGAEGEAGTFTFAGADDLAASPSLGAGTDGYILVYDHDETEWVPTAQKVGDLYVPGSITSKASNNTSTHAICSISVPAQPFDWRPVCFGQSIITGSSDTRVDLVARLDNATTGDVVGYSYGVVGATPPPNILIPASPAGSSVPGSYGKVDAGNAGIIYFRAEQKAASSNNWSLSNSNTSFAVQVQPL